MRILLVEDDPSTAKSVGLILNAEGHQVSTTHLGREGLDLGRLYDFDAIILDLNLPDISGYDMLRALRDAKIDTPVLILSGMAEAEKKVRALGYGADDYLTKPFDRRELVARLQAIARRAKGHAQPVVSIGRIAVNLDSHTVAVEGRPIKLTAKEYQVVELLALRKGTTLTKEMFLNHLYGGIDEPELKIVDVFVCKLRKKLAQANGGEHGIETVWGRGYVMRDPVPKATASAVAAKAAVKPGKAAKPAKRAG
ncbi:MAG: response regulator transcription factor [Alphaproteobacteria bacterium]|nr:response regulator transcription factor [Alphaproteobacteria bacterium]